jgi:hypothetical protein
VDEYRAPHYDTRARSHAVPIVTCTLRASIHIARAKLELHPLPNVTQAVSRKHPAI